MSNEINDLAQTPSLFSEFALPEPLLEAIDDLGFTECTPIQSAVLPFSLSDYDITGQAQTGTGKTAAFLITILTKLWEEGSENPGKKFPRALILAPTRELAMQIESDGRELSKYMGFTLQSIVGGIDYQKQLNSLQSDPADIVVATPGRLIDFLNRKYLSLGDIKTLVIDEADRMLDMGFIPDVRSIVYKTPQKSRRQTLFFSATFSEPVIRLANSWTLKPERVVIEPENVATDTVDQQFWLTSTKEKNQLLAKFMSTTKPNRALIFANRRDRAHSLMKYLKQNDISCEVLAGDIPQPRRLATLKRFKEGGIPYVVATDVAGRGIHVEGISHVVNYDLPEDPQDYVHRIGRTGRAGAPGISISLISEDDAFNLPLLEEFLGSPINCIQPTV
ncbi:MAG: ATP-dependent RNA helicase RhlB [Gammaproteobacteria bacterium]|nr:ATP-dependent RNA helicase RhlB [Gammaproteobacteria bacterium]